MMYSLRESLGGMLLIVSILGGIAVLLKERSLKGLFILSFPIIFYIHLVFASQRFSRYVLPLIPFAAICSAYLFFEVILPRVKKKGYKAFIVGVALLVVFPTAIKSVRACILFSREDTRIVSAAWITKNLEKGTTLAVDHTSFRPAILQTKEQLLDKYSISGQQ